jgi:hypothetical protein
LTRIVPRLVFAVETTVPLLPEAKSVGGFTTKIAAASTMSAAAPTISFGGSERATPLCSFVGILSS